MTETPKNPDGSDVEINVQPADPPEKEPKQPEGEKDKKGFDPVQTAHVIARQDPEVIKATLGILAGKLPPDLYGEDELPTPPPPPADDKGEKKEGHDQYAERIAELERQNWINEAVIDWKLSNEHKQFITGKSKNAIRTSAYKLAEMLKEKGNNKPDEDVPPPPPPGENVEPPKSETPDKPLPKYEGYTTQPSVEECEKALAEGLAEKDWFGGKK